MSFLRSWRLIPRTLRRGRRASNNVPEAEGPEMPRGFLFNEKPLLPGEKRVKEWWENIYIYGMGFNFVLMFIVAVLSPDTSVESWAREKAEERVAEIDRCRALEKEAALAQETEVMAFVDNNQS